MADDLGTDLKLGPDGDIPVTPSGDLALVSGPANLAQGLSRRALRPRGALLWAPGYGAGLFQFLERPNNPSNRGLAGQLLRANLRADPRVQSVEVAVAYDPTKPQQVTLSISGVAITGERIDASQLVEV